MKKLTKSGIKEMSITPESAVKATIWKWSWICQATKKDLLSGNWPDCGLCIYYQKFGACNDCPLKSCVEDDDLYTKVAIAYDKLFHHEITLAQFRVIAKRMLKKIKAIKT